MIQNILGAFTKIKHFIIILSYFRYQSMDIVSASAVARKKVSVNTSRRLFTECLDEGETLKNSFSHHSDDPCVRFQRVCRHRGGMQCDFSLL